MGVTTRATTPPCMGNLEVESLMIDGEAVLRLKGELDLTSAEMLGDAARLVHAQGTPTIVLDLSALEFIDSSGLRQFVVALKRQREIGGDVVLRAPTDQTRRVLEIVGLTEIFTITSGTEVPPAGDSGHRSMPEEQVVPEMGVSGCRTDGSAEALGQADRS